MAGCEAMQGQRGILVLSPDSALIFLHTHSKLTATLVHKGAGALRARDAIHNIPPSLRVKGVLHVHQCFSVRFRWHVGDAEVVGS